MPTTPTGRLPGTATVCGIGASLPPDVLSNDDVAREGALDVTDEWIRARTGIARRHRAGTGVATGDLATAAGRAAIESAAGTPPDLVLVATTTPDRRCPATAPEVAHRLGLGTVPAFDLAAVCSGFVYALTVATGLVRAGTCARPLVIGAETYSTIVDPRDRNTAILFGDGAGAVLLRGGEPTEPGAVLATDLGADGSGGDLISIAAGGSRAPATTASAARDHRYLRMRGREVYALAVRQMTRSSHAVLRQAGWPASSVGAFIGHQANQRILDAVGERLGIAPRHRFGNIQDVGNTAAASVPLALADTAARGLVRPGTRTLLTAFGGGLTWGTVALGWPAAIPRTAPPSPLAARPEPHQRKEPSWSPSTTT
ncbi:beta-ketoacyl-ACP synthase III [Streptomyces millisiae]|uniref:Beta-ketoacyl-[acyl-carrier-protein] synthase III n=1 Tax=Streptomyces millisiae TaxID=3075542 RepID=A0ABU2LVK3_9ACTN|nr:beta-ketoacyl-ACP synthase III [Streptomyces sp. DSM 44918]MDT0321626.1 beta-ketoacyl-ACP synthase III [Streptomyces sp. DSM 44918]